jgi:hypothetical protein
MGRSTAVYETRHSDLELLPATQSDEADVRTLLGKLGVTAADLASGWSSRVSSAFVVRSGSQLVAYMSWPALRPESVVIRGTRRWKESKPCCRQRCFAFQGGPRS